MARWYETNDYDDGEQPGKQDTPSGWSGPFGPPKPKRSLFNGCTVVIFLVLAGYALGALSALPYGGHA
jgi:hypothetical protein